MKGKILYIMIGAAKKSRVAAAMSGGEEAVVKSFEFGNTRKGLEWPLAYLAGGISWPRGRAGRHGGDRVLLSSALRLHRLQRL